MQNAENENVKQENKEERKSMPINEITTLPNEPRMPANRTTAVSKDFRFAVSQEQFNLVKTEHKTSMDLLNSSANALLGAMEGMIPPPDSGRVVGEYTGQAMRYLAKSICDVIQTKTGVVRSMYSISRDEM